MIPITGTRVELHIDVQRRTIQQIVQSAAVELEIAGEAPISGYDIKHPESTQGMVVEIDLSTTPGFPRPSFGS